MCGAGCGSANQTFTFTGMDTVGFIGDLYRFRLCHEGVAGGLTFTIANNVSGVYQFSHGTVPSCDSGYINFSIFDANSSGVADFTLSVWSSAPNAVNALVLVDSFGGVDRLHNHTEVMTWNASLDRFVSGEEHEYYESGSVNVSFDCYGNVSSVQNQTGNLMSVTVNNADPFLVLDSIWDWFSGQQSFVSGVAAKYPLSVPFLNVSAVCSDVNLDSIVFNLSYFNGSLIDSHTFSVFGDVGGVMRNYSQGNFSTNFSFLDGTFGYYLVAWCNDTDGASVSFNRSFTAENDVSVAAWINSSPLQVTNVPAVLNWSCTDVEGESSVAYLFINNTNLSAPNQTGGTGYSFSLGEGVWNLSVWCSDSFRNGSLSGLLLTYRSACLINLSVPCAGCRYQDNEINAGLSCTNGISITSCSYFINDFAPYVVSNCSDFNITAERGWNVLVVNVTGNGVSTGVVRSFFAKDMDAGIWDYPVIWFLIAVCVLVGLFAAHSGLGIFYVVSGLLVFILGLNLFIFSKWVGGIVCVVGLLGGLLMVVKK